jgi:hypothetical protein
MAKVTITRNTAAGGFDLKSGQTVELSEEDALTLIRMGKAVPATASSAPESRDGEIVKKRSTRKKSKNV